MGAFVLPTIAAGVLFIVICSWIALARYDKNHPPPQDNEPGARPNDPRRR